MNRWATGASSLGLGLALLCGPVAVVLALGSGAEQTRPAVEAGGADVAGAAAAGEFAERAVVAWLRNPGGEAGADELSGLFAAELPTEQREPWPVQGASASAIAELDQQMWAVTVGVDVREPAPEGQQDGDTDAVWARRYFQVPVHQNDGALVAASLPAAVAAPAQAEAPALGYGTELARSSPLWATTEEFLGVLLTGQGEITRYVAPGADIAAISPPPYAEVSVTEMSSGQERTEDAEPAPQDDETVRVLAGATAKAGGGRQMQLQYALALTARDGRWEITEISPSPQLASNSSDQPGTPSEEPGEPDASATQ